MKINFLVPEINLTGGMRLIFEYANRLIERGHQVILYSKIIPYNQYKAEIRPYFIKYRIKYTLRYIFGKIKTAENLLNNKFTIKYILFANNISIKDADALFATSWPTSFTVNKLSKKKGKKFYLIQDYEIWNSNKKYVDLSYSLPLKRITISNYLKKLLLEKFNSDSTLILNGINFDRFYNDNKIFNKTPGILFMDHILENKNVDGAIETVIRIKKDFPDINVSAFGIRKYHNIPDFVKFHSNLTDEEVRKLYCNSDIFIFPSKYEGFGGPPAEAMACKCAVVGNSVGALPDFAIDRVTAIFADPEQPNGLYEGVKYLIENPDVLKKISLAGYENVRKVLDFNKAVIQLENLLNNK